MQMKTKTIPIALMIASGASFLLGGCVSGPASAPVRASALSAKSTAPEKTAISGVPMTAYLFYEVQPDCTSSGVPIILVTKPAAHGEIDTKEIERYPEYPSNNSRFECNHTKSPMAVVIYTPAKDFVGTDLFSVKAVFHNGQAIERKFPVRVEAKPKPGPVAAVP
jgi:hypothetical protein